MSDDVEAVKVRLLLMADQGDYGRKPDPSDVRRVAADLLSRQSQQILELREALVMAVAEMEAIRPNVGPRQNARLGCTCDFARATLANSQPSEVSHG